MRSIVTPCCIFFLAGIAVPTSLGAVVVEPLPELTTEPLPIDGNSSHTIPVIPINLGVSFEQIDTITFSIAGDLPTHSWLHCDLNSGCASSPTTFDSWRVSLSKPGFPYDNAFSYFEASGFINRDISLGRWDDSDWSSLQTGELEFRISPIPEGFILGTAYWDLVSPPVVDLSEATLTLTGDFEDSMPAPDYNGNGLVDAADYTKWRDSMGQVDGILAADGNANGRIDSGDYEMWKAHFGHGVASGSGTSVPEPSSQLLVLFSALAGLIARVGECRAVRVCPRR